MGRAHDGGDAANNTDLVKIAGKDAAKGYFFISPPSAHDFDTPEAKDFFSRYKAQYNSLPSSVWSVLAGDAFKVIVAALRPGRMPIRKPWPSTSRRISRNIPA